MVAGTTKSFNFGPLFFLLMIGAFLMATFMFISQATPVTVYTAQQASSSIQVPALGSAEWNMVDPFGDLGGVDHYENLKNALKGLLVYSTANASWEALNPSDFNLPYPDEICKEVQKLTGLPCEWQVNKITNADGSTLIEVVLKSGETVLAKGQAGRILAKEMVELLPQQIAHYTHGWIASLEVASWLRGLHLGTFMWKSLDSVLKTYSVNVFGENAMRIFADASKVGWGPKLMSGLTHVWEIADKTWVYIIK